ncbi:MAG: YciI family protein [Mycobacterium sp.]
MKQYLLSMIQPDGEIPPPEVLEGIMAEVGRIREQLLAQGSWVFGNGLHSPTTATTMRIRNGELLTTDGPFAESKEHLGGITIIEVADLDEALSWGRRYAEATTLHIEVRPFQGGTQ